MRDRPLSEQFPWLFAGLSPFEVEIRDHFYSSQLNCEVPEMIARLERDHPEPPLEPEAATAEDDVSFLLDLLEHIGGEAVRERAARQIDINRDAARKGRTRGQQEASIRFRTPGHWMALVLREGERFDIRNFARFTGGDILSDYRTLRRYELLAARMREILGSSKRDRSRNHIEIHRCLVSAFPEIARSITPGDIADLTPDLAAKKVFAKREGMIGHRRVDKLLADARKFVGSFDRATFSIEPQRRRGKAKPQKPRPRSTR